MSIKEYITSANLRIAVAATIGMSTMTCVYMFLALSLLPLVFPALTTFCMYISSTIIQLIALPLIMVGQNLMGREQERRATEDHLALIEMMSEMRTLLKDADTEVDELAHVANRLEKIETRIEQLQNKA